MRALSGASLEVGGVAVCEDLEVVGNRLVQPIANGGDPCVNVGLVRDMKCAFGVVGVVHGVVCAVSSAVRAPTVPR